MPKLNDSKLGFYECLSKICDMLHVTCLRFNGQCLRIMLP